MRKAAFVDRDGVLVRNIPRSGFKIPTAPFSFDEFELYDGVKDALALLQRHGFLTILVTNQPDIAYGRIKKDEWKKIQDEVEKLPLDDIYACLHTADAKCRCRKPKPGMLLKARKKWDIDLNQSYMIGDTEADLGAGRAAGCTTILIDREYNAGLPSLRASSLSGAVELVIAHERARV